MSILAFIATSVSFTLIGFLIGCSRAIEDHQPIVAENDFLRQRLYDLTAHPSLSGQGVRAASQGKAGRTHLTLVRGA